VIFGDVDLGKMKEKHQQTVTEEIFNTVSWWVPFIASLSSSNEARKHKDPPTLPCTCDMSLPSLD